MKHGVPWPACTCGTQPLRGGTCLHCLAYDAMMAYGDAWKAKAPYHDLKRLEEAYHVAQEAMFR